MEGELFKRVYAWCERVVRPGPAGCHYSDRRIVATYLWAVIHDRPMCWACQARSGLAKACGWVDQPSRSTLSRRLASPAVQQALRELERALQALWPDGPVQFIDGKPLVVGSCSKDRDAGYGRAGNGMAKGYKLHAIRQADGPVRAWTVEPMNVSEVKVAECLIDRVHGPGWLVGDGEYDVGHLYERAAGQQLQLVAPAPAGAGQGHRPQSPHRLAGLALARTPAGRRLLALRIGIDQFFGQLGNYGGGLSPLPNWVRRRHRVRLWVQAKLILHLVRLTLRQRVAA